jgi:glycerophosphoryl diester phosphodiesterase
MFTLAAALLLSGCAALWGPKPPTLDGKPPLVIAHRGASGYLPEHTLEAYQLAIEQGADVIEQDLVVTKDGHLIVRHDVNLALSTDVASRPEFAHLKRSDWLVDGVKQTGWFAHDFTLEQVKRLGAIITDAERPQQFNGKFQVPTFDEVIAFTKAQSAKHGRPIGIYPETKSAYFHRQLGLGLEPKLLQSLTNAGWNSASAPVFVQSFEPSSLLLLRTLGLKAKAVQLIGSGRNNLATGTMSFVSPNGVPFDWLSTGDKRTYGDMLTPEGLAQISKYAQGIGPFKLLLIGAKAVPDANGKLEYKNALSQTPSPVIANAHRAGLFVHPYTYRNEARRLNASHKGDPKAEYAEYYAAGVDGVFTDFPDTAVQARAAYISGLRSR